MRRRFLALFLPLSLTLAACASNPTGTEVASGSEFLLRPGESATVEDAGLAVRFDVVASDSRCPADAVCIQLGSAEAVFTVSEAGRPGTSLTLQTSPRDGQRTTVDKEEDALAGSGLQQPIHFVSHRKCLAGAGGHSDEHLSFVLRDRLFDGGVGFDLIRTQPRMLVRVFAEPF